MATWIKGRRDTEKERGREATARELPHLFFSNTHRQVKAPCMCTVPSSIEGRGISFSEEEFRKNMLEKWVGAICSFMHPSNIFEAPALLCQTVYGAGSL